MVGSVKGSILSSNELGREGVGVEEGDILGGRCVWGMGAVRMRNWPGRIKQSSISAVGEAHVRGRGGTLGWDTVKGAVSVPAA